MNKLLYTSLYALMIGGTLALSVSNPVMAKGISGDQTSGSTMDWESKTLDPGTGGLQLPQTGFSSVQGAYDDTLGPGQGFTSSQVRGASSTVTSATKLKEDAAKAAEEARRLNEETKANEQARKKLESDLTNEYNSRYAVSKSKGEAVQAATAKLKAACEENNTHTFRFSHDCEGSSLFYEPSWNSTSELKDAYKEYVSARNEFLQAAESTNNALIMLNEIKKLNGEAVDDTTMAQATALEAEYTQAMAELAAANQMAGITETDKSAVAAATGLAGVTTDNWDAQMQTDYTRNRLEQSFKELEYYGGPHIDLSTEEGQNTAKEMIDFLNGRDTTTSNSNNTTTSN